MYTILLGTHVYKYQFKSTLSVPLGIYPGVELLDHMTILFSILRNHHPVSTVAAPLYILPEMHEGQCFHIYTNKVGNQGRAWKGPTGVWLTAGCWGVPCSDLVSICPPSRCAGCTCSCLYPTPWLLIPFEFQVQSH
jgi:hypothetical protein